MNLLRTLLLIAWLGVCGWTEPIKTFPASSKRFALVIGVDTYADTQISTLGGAGNDAKVLAKSLIQHGGFPAEQVTVLASDQPAERQPTRGNILRRLSNLASVVPKDGLLLISFSGHGMERGGQAFLLPGDAQVSDDVDLLEQTAINVSQVKERIKKIGVDQVVLLLDACRNDPAGRANKKNPLTTGFTKGFSFDTLNREVSAFATIYATEVGQRAYEYKEKGQGYFTWAVVEALGGGAANDKGEITLGALVRYLQDRVPKRVFQDLGAGNDQRPFAVIEGYKADDLVVAVAGKTVTADPPSNGEVRERRSDRHPLVGTKWFGSTARTGEFEFELLSDGKLTYSTKGILNGEPHLFVTPGTWQETSGNVLLNVRNYSIWQGKLEGDTMKGTSANRDGDSFNYLLFRKK
jgi:hypothetical protein